MPILNVNQKRVAKPKPGLGDASDYTDMVLRNAQVSVQPIGVPRLSPTGNFLNFVPFWPAKRMYEEKLEYLNHIDDPPPYVPFWTAYGGTCWNFTTKPPLGSTSAIQPCDAAPGAPSFGPFYALLSNPFRGTCEFTMNVRYDTDIGFMIDPVNKIGFKIRPYVTEPRYVGDPGRARGSLLVYNCGPMALPGSPIAPSGDGGSGYYQVTTATPGFDYPGTGAPLFTQNSDRVRIELTTTDTPVRYWTREQISSVGNPVTDIPPLDQFTKDIIKVYIVSGAVDGTGKYIGGGTVRYHTYIPVPPNSLIGDGLYPYISSSRYDLLSGVGLKPDEYKDFIFT